jgi:hypothetical protein
MLHNRLQDALNGVNSCKRVCERVLLLFGTCGNAVLDLVAGDFELILPRVDDCISLLFGSVSLRAEFARKHSAYYLTQGWLSGERNLWAEYLHTVKQYGEEQAKEIANELYGNYKTLALLNTGACPINKLINDTKIIADTFSLKQIEVPATTSYIEELISGPWTDERYIIKSPNSKIVFDDLKL